MSRFDFSSLAKYRDEAKKTTTTSAPLKEKQAAAEAESAKTTRENKLSEKLPESAPSESAISWNNQIASIWADAVFSKVPFFQEGEVGIQDFQAPPPIPKFIDITEVIDELPSYDAFEPAPDDF
jgi:hypothetical protein